MTQPGNPESPNAAETGSERPRQIFYVRLDPPQPIAGSHLPGPNGAGKPPTRKAPRTESTPITGSETEPSSETNGASSKQSPTDEKSAAQIPADERPAQPQPPSNLPATPLPSLSETDPEDAALRHKLIELRDQHPDPACSIAPEGAPAGHSAASPTSACATDNAEDRRMVHFARQVVQILKNFWAARPLLGTVVGRGEEKPSIAPASLPANHNTAEMYLQVMPDTLHLWLRLAEDFIAIQVASYIARLFPHLRNTMLFVTLSILLVLGAIFTYPFQPQRYLLVLVWLLIMVTGPLTVFILLQINRDEILSRIAKSEPGKVTWDRHFISQVVVYGVLPLFSFIASQFPEVRGVAFSWLESLLKTLK